MIFTHFGVLFGIAFSFKITPKGDRVKHHRSFFDFHVFSPLGGTPGRFWSMFGRFLIDFGTMFGRFRDDFWSILYKCFHMYSFCFALLGYPMAPICSILWEHFGDTQTNQPTNQPTTNQPRTKHFSQIVSSYFKLDFTTSWVRKRRRNTFGEFFWFASVCKTSSLKKQVWHEFANFNWQQSYSRSHSDVAF